MVPKPDDIGIAFVYYLAPDAEVVELVDTTDSKSVAFAGLGVRVPPSVPNSKTAKRRRLCQKSAATSSRITKPIKSVLRLKASSNGQTR